MVLGFQDLMDLEPAEQLEGGNVVGHPADMHLIAGGHEQPLVVVAPSHRRHGML